MKTTLMSAALLVAAMSATPALADGKIYVQLPDLSSYQGPEAEDFLYQIVLANIVASNCTGYEITDEEWSLLTDSADILARGQLGLSVDDYDDQYFSPAFDALDEADTCETMGPKVQPILDELVNLGGSRDALPDQDKAYEDWSAMQAGWDAPRTKTKIK